MRLLIDSLIALMLVAFLAGVIFHHRQKQDMARQYQTAYRELSSMRETMAYNSALEQGRLNDLGYAPYVSPFWFPEGLPTNRLVPGRHPWVDIAPPGDMNDQPPDPAIHNHDQAGYWYNPNRGVIRARVPQQFTEQDTLELYNKLNSTHLLALPRSKDPARQPLPHPLLSDSLNDNDQQPKRITLRNVSKDQTSSSSSDTTVNATATQPALKSTTLLGAQNSAATSADSIDSLAGSADVKANAKTNVTPGTTLLAPQPAPPAAAKTTGSLRSTLVVETPAVDAQP